MLQPLGGTAEMNLIGDGEERLDLGASHVAESTGNVWLCRTNHFSVLHDG